MFEYKFVKSRRKTIGITVKSDGTVILRAPLYCSRKRAEEFLFEKREWVEKTREKILKQAGGEKPQPFTEKELNVLKKKAKEIIPPMVSEIANEMGIDYGRITIRAQKTVWGSCTSKGNLNFNCLLMLVPENVQRYVIVHELAHRREMNHSQKFWALVANYHPTYISDRRYLKKDGESLIRRLP